MKKIILMLLVAVMFSSVAFALEPPILYGPESVQIGDSAGFWVDDKGQKNVVAAYCFGEPGGCVGWYSSDEVMYYYYSLPGEYHVTAGLFSLDYSEQAWSKPVQVKVLWDYPTIWGPGVVTLGQEVTFQATNYLYDVEHRFDFGDGTITDWCGPDCVFYHTFTSPGGNWVRAQARLPGADNMSDWSWTWMEVGEELKIITNVSGFVTDVPHDLKISLVDAKNGRPLSGGEVCVDGSGHYWECYYVGSEVIIPDFKAMTSEPVGVYVTKAPPGYVGNVTFIPVCNAVMKVKAQIHNSGGNLHKVSVWAKNKKTRAGVEQAYVFISGAIEETLTTDGYGFATITFKGEGLIYIDFWKDGYDEPHTLVKRARYRK